MKSYLRIQLKHFESLKVINVSNGAHKNWMRWRMAYFSKAEEQRRVLWNTILFKAFIRNTILFKAIAQPDNV